MEKEGVGGREILSSASTSSAWFAIFFFFPNLFQLDFEPTISSKEKKKEGNISLKHGKWLKIMALSLPFQLVLISRNNNRKTPKFRVKILTEQFRLHAAHRL